MKPSFSLQQKGLKIDENPHILVLSTTGQRTIDSKYVKNKTLYNIIISNIIIVLS